MHIFCFAILLTAKRCFGERLRLFCSSFQSGFRGLTFCLCPLPVLLHSLGGEGLSLTCSKDTLLCTSCFAATRLLLHICLRVSSDAAFPHLTSAVRVSPRLLGLLTGIACSLHVPEMTPSS